MKSTALVLAALFCFIYAFKRAVDSVIPDPHKMPPATGSVLSGTGNTSEPVAGGQLLSSSLDAATGGPRPSTPPYVAELQAEIEARENQLDELSNALASAIAERNEAIALLQQMGALRQVPNL